MRRAAGKAGRGIPLLLAALMPVTAAASSDGTTNLAPNPGFETADANNRLLPEGWCTFSIGADCDIRLYSRESLEGTRSLRINMIPRVGAVQGVVASLPVEPKTRYDFSVSAKRARDVLSSAAGYFKLVVEWLDEHSGEITRKESAPVALGSLSRKRWKRFELRKLRVPRRAVTAKFSVQFFSTGPGRGVVLLDDVRIAATWKGR
ncbi:MAG TPA: hypothetical protein ENG36_02415 [Lentisphaerae bacterium]|nr:hypothetical protein [Lentisphaerota bacterium]